MKYLYIILLFLGVICSCSEKKTTIKDTSQLVDNDTLPMQYGDELLMDNEVPFNLVELKNKYEDGSTSTMLNNKNVILYKKPDSSGYYGRYTFSDYYEKDVYRIGSLTIFNDETPWMYDTLNEKFIEITAKYPGILIFDKIQVGVEVSVVEECLGNPFMKEDNIIIYKNEDISRIALFVIKENKVKSYKLGYYKDEVLKDIPKYIPELLKGI